MDKLYESVQIVLVFHYVLFSAHPALGKMS